ncbi:ATP-binding protein [Microbacterium tenebrionis]|uniref:ATP-binding protein n=1 Tax=Microbacterium tenebrionis TaxID=2830665 RepID=UPI00158DF23D|nr:ATP-binding protein [Microbacterium ihumii]
MREETLIPGVELLESMRSVGYSFEAATADIVDNSIAANATQIDIIADAVDGHYICICDNGTGMFPDEARDALKLAGTRNVERMAHDLGRFGLGLKTASLSQGRRLTVVTKRDGISTGLQWDVDFVLETGNWAIRVLDPDDIVGLPHSELIDEAEHGTLVIWESLDYFLAGAHDVASWMSNRLSELRAHLGLVFQRFLEGRGALRLTVNGIVVAPIDPFLEGNPRTQVAPIERVSIDGHAVAVEAFTLPHSSYLSAKERKREDLGTRMREHQGFYVYRNRRLISAGGWFGLSKQDELSKQTRVRVDVPPELDHHWQLDIKKSRIEPPQAFRSRLRQIIDQVKAKSTRMHSFRGRRASTSEFAFLWTLVEDRGGFRYEVNADHPSVQAIRNSLPVDRVGGLESLLADLAGGIPASDIYARMAENQQRLVPQLGDDQVRLRLRSLRNNGAAATDRDAMSAALAKIEPFNAVPNLRSLIEEVWEESDDAQP